MAEAVAVTLRRTRPSRKQLRVMVRCEPLTSGMPRTMGGKDSMSDPSRLAYARTSG